MKQDIRQSQTYTNEQWNAIKCAAVKCNQKPAAFVRLASVEKAGMVNDGKMPEGDTTLMKMFKFFIYGPEK